MTNAEQRAAAKQFYLDWDGKGDEKQETQSFWFALLHKVLGVEEPDKFIEFEVKVKLDNTSYIDAYIGTTKVLIEQKSIDKDLHKSYKQSDGSFLTPYQQARRYAGYLPHSKNPRWIVVSNFKSFEIYDMNKPNDEPIVINLDELEKQYHLLNFLVEEGNTELKKEMEISLKAGEVVGKIYDSLHQQYANPDSIESQQSLNKLCVRLVFCLYAEDAGLFDKHGMFHDYLAGFSAQQMRKALIDLFKVLNQREDERDQYLKDDNPLLSAFPYVNGGLFADDKIEIPPFTEEIKNLLLENAGAEFDWSDISPTIFGAVFESTLNPETRRSGGMHYTSIENIHKVIDPLFMDELNEELDEIRELTVLNKRNSKLKEFQQKLSELVFLDPACGSGNFLTETYLSLRKLENEVLMLLLGEQVVMGFDELTPIKVSISQFYGIEINDFAVTVAKTAMWIAESQMMKRTEDIIHMNLDFLPLKSNVTIVEGNALRLDWNDIVPKEKLNYIMGNPPFIGAMWSKGTQREDIKNVFPECKKTGQIDYVAGWYAKTAKLIENTVIRCAFVSTNSICQGQQVGLIWEPLMNIYNIKIDFAYRTFRWDSEASIKAQVHCIIVGFSHSIVCTEKKIYTGGGVYYR